MKEHRLRQIYTIMGLAAAAVLGVGVYRKLRGNSVTPDVLEIRQKQKSKRSAGDYDENEPLEITTTILDPELLLEENGGPVGMAMVYVPEVNDFNLVGLNRPPKSAAQAGDNGTSEYYKTLSRMYGPKDFMSEGDYKALQEINVIPKDFPPDRVIMVYSHNGVNKFMVGYSEEYRQETSAETVTAITPLWAVAFGAPFDTSLLLPDDMSDEDLRAVAPKIMMAEGMLTRPNGGCHASQGPIECGAEKAAIMSIMLERLRLKRAKIDADATLSSVIMGPGQRWNTYSAFMDKYSNLPLTQAEQLRFNYFYNNQFWHMPQLTDTATHYCHHFAVNKIPSWIIDSSQMTPTQDTPNYANQRVIRIGRLLSSDNSRTFK
jgi:hypothetical protein